MNKGMALHDSYQSPIACILNVKIGSHVFVNRTPSQLGEMLVCHIGLAKLERNRHDCQNKA